MPAQLLEICCDSPASVRLALLGGADRVELCARSSLAVGGLTPSVGLAARSLAHCSPHQLVAMVRCRCGDFNYDAGEVDEMCHDVAALRARGVTTFAFGALTPDGSVDAAALGRIAAAIGKESKLVFHRAIDELLAACFSLQEIDALVQQLALLGVCRILSSGGADSALKGRSTLFVLQKTCERHGVELCVAGGVRRGVAAALRATGAMQFHAASAVAEIIHRGASGSLFAAADQRVDPDKVRGLVAALRAAAAQDGTDEDDSWYMRAWRSLAPSPPSARHRAGTAR